MRRKSDTLQVTIGTGSGCARAHAAVHMSFTPPDCNRPANFAWILPYQQREAAAKLEALLS
jgi:hypothetical protein